MWTTYEGLGPPLGGFIGNTYEATHWGSIYAPQPPEGAQENTMRQQINQSVIELGVSIQTVKMPKRSRLCHAGEFEAGIALSFICDTDPNGDGTPPEIEERMFRIFELGQVIPGDNEWRYVETVQVSGRAYHVHEYRRPAKCGSGTPQAFILGDE
jgi:hypothetical protein